MKVIVMLILCICSGVEAYGQSVEGHAKVGISLIEATAKNTLCFNIGYAFSKHWSAEGCAWKCFPVKDRQTEEEKLHNSLLDKTEKTAMEQNTDGFRAEACYWPSEAFHGLFFSIGYEYDEQGDSDGCMRIGYMMNVWKGITMSMSMKTGVMKLIAGTERPAEHIDIGINYIF